MKIGFTQSTNWAFPATGDKPENEVVHVEAGFTLNGDSGLFFAAVGGRASGGASFYRSNEEAYARIWANDIKSGTVTGEASCLQLRRAKNSTDVNGFKQEIYSLTKAAGVSVRCVKTAN